MEWHRKINTHEDKNCTSQQPFKWVVIHVFYRILNSLTHSLAWCGLHTRMTGFTTQSNWSETLQSRNKSAWGCGGFMFVPVRVSPLARNACEKTVLQLSRPSSQGVDRSRSMRDSGAEKGRRNTGVPDDEELLHHCDIIEPNWSTPTTLSPSECVGLMCGHLLSRER